VVVRGCFAEAPIIEGAHKKQRLPLGQPTQEICDARASFEALALGVPFWVTMRWGAPADSPIMCMLNAFPARASATTARSTHICAALVGEVHTARSRGTPTLPALELRHCLARKEISAEKQPHTCGTRHTMVNARSKAYGLQDLDALPPAMMTNVNSLLKL
jgi:hypothetical protein